MKREFELLITIINKGFSEHIIEAARAKGASGGTIVFGRGTAPSETENFLGFKIEPEKEIVLTLVKAELKDEIMDAICNICRIHEDGRGICFSLPVNDVAGITHLMVKTSDDENK